MSEKMLEDMNIDLHAFRKAQETPADENMFRQLRLNQWVKQSVRWMPIRSVVNDIREKISQLGMDDHSFYMECTENEKNIKKKFFKIIDFL